MTEYLIPTDERFIEAIAKSIAKARMLDDAGYDIDTIVSSAVGIDCLTINKIDKIVNEVFEGVWNSSAEEDKVQREMYMKDAVAAISAMNLELLTLTE